MTERLDALRDQILNLQPSDDLVQPADHSLRARASLTDRELDDFERLPLALTDGRKAGRECLRFVSVRGAEVARVFGDGRDRSDQLSADPLDGIARVFDLFRELAQLICDDVE